jgi:hypothetical protein
MRTVSDRVATQGSVDVRYIGGDLERSESAILDERTIPMDLLRPDGFHGRPPRPSRGGAVRIVGPVPAGVVVCLCCGPIPVARDVTATATAAQHTRSAAHPTVYAAGGA